jgi:triacylglycerol lipase
MVASLRRHGHLHDQAMRLRHHGVLAYAPNVPPYNPVPIRAAFWRDRIEHVLQETGATRVNLIAHSMGGLDARWLIGKEGYHEKIASLITIATPHHGSSIASFLLEQPDRLQEWLSDFANWMGTQVMRDVEADFIKTVAELTPDYLCEQFNPEVPDHPDIKYWSYSAQAGKGAHYGISPFLRPLNYILFNREGSNDGFVSVESAKWGEFCGVIDADHAQQIGLQFPSRNTFNSLDFFCDLARKLAEAGF